MILDFDKLYHCGFLPWRTNNEGNSEIYFVPAAAFHHEPAEVKEHRVRRDIFTSWWDFSQTEHYVFLSSAFDDISKRLPPDLLFLDDGSNLARVLRRLLPQHFTGDRFTIVVDPVTREWIDANAVDLCLSSVKAAQHLYRADTLLREGHTVGLIGEFPTLIDENMEEGTRPLARVPEFCIRDPVDNLSAYLLGLRYPDRFLPNFSMFFLDNMLRELRLDRHCYIARTLGVSEINSGVLARMLDPLHQIVQETQWRDDPTPTLLSREYLIPRRFSPAMVTRVDRY